MCVYVCFCVCVTTKKKTQLRLVGKLDKFPGILKKFANVAFFVEFSTMLFGVLSMAIGLAIAALPTFGVSVYGDYAVGVVTLGIVLAFLGMLLRLPVITAKVGSENLSLK